MSARMFLILIVCFASIAFADDFKTIDGKEYKNAKVSRVEPDGIVLITSSGISKVYFTELPKEVQERFHYDAQKAAEFTSQTTDKINQLLQQRAEERNGEPEKERSIGAKIQRRNPNGISYPPSEVLHSTDLRIIRQQPPRSCSLNTQQIRLTQTGNIRGEFSPSAEP